MSAQNIELSGNLFVSGSSILSESLDVSGDVVVDGTLDVSGGVAFGDRLDVSGDVVVDGTLDVSGNVDIYGETLNIINDTNPTLEIKTSTGGGGRVFLGNVNHGIQRVGNVVDVRSGGSVILRTNGLPRVRVQANGQVNILNNLDVSGGVFFGDRLDVSGDVAVEGNMGIGGDSSSEKLKVYGDVNITGNINVDGSFSFSEVVQNTTTVNNTLLVSTQLDVSNEGTGPALKVSQLGDGDDQDVALFNAGGEGNALKIDSSGNTFVYKDIDISGHTSLHDVSCNGNVDISGGVLTIVGNTSDDPIMTIRKNDDGVIFDTIVIRRIENFNQRISLGELQLWVNGDNILPDITNNTSDNGVGNALNDQIAFFDNDTNKTTTFATASNGTQFPASNIKNDNLGTDTTSNNEGVSVYIPLTSTRNAYDIQAIVLYNRTGEFTDRILGLRIELYNKVGDPNLSSPLVFTSKIETDTRVYRFDFPAISAYPSGSFVDADSATNIVSESYALTETILAPRTGLKIENAGLEVGGSATIDGGLEVGGSATIDGGLTVTGGGSIYTNDNRLVFRTTNSEGGPQNIGFNLRRNGQKVLIFVQALSWGRGIIHFCFRDTQGNNNDSDIATQSDSKARITSTGAFTAVSITPTSDDRLKKNEKFITNAIQSISKLRPQIYDKYSTLKCDDGFIVESGLIAQEIYYDAPELRHLVSVPDDADISGHILTSEDPSIDPDYSTWGSTPASVNYNGFIAYLIKAIQEQQEIINEEKAKNQSQYNELLARIQSLEPPPTEEPVNEPVVEPVVEPVLEPVTEPVVEPTTELVTEEPVLEPVPTEQESTEPVVESVVSQY